MDTAQAVRAAFEGALADPGRVDAAVAVAEAFLAAHAGDPVAMAYLGSLTGMRADAAVLPWVKLRHANAAAALLEAAHARRRDPAPAGAEGDAYPAALVVAMLRGVAYASFPVFLGRSEAARDSLEEAVRHPAFPAIPAPYRALACSHLAVLHARASAHRDAGRLLDAARDADAALAEAVWARR